MTNPQMVMQDARLFDEISATRYGMGFFLTHYRSEKLVHHGGDMPGGASPTHRLTEYIGDYAQLGYDVIAITLQG